MAGKRQNPDLRGLTFGKRKVIGVAPPIAHEMRYFARCECGHVGPVYEKALIKGKALCCVSCARKETYRRQAEEMVGQTYGERKVLSVVEAPVGMSLGRGYVMTKCACGFTAPIVASHLRLGKADRCPSCAGGVRRRANQKHMECRPCA